MFKKIVAIILVYCFFLQCLGLDLLNIPGTKVNFGVTKVQAAAAPTPAPLLKLDKENETIWVDDALPAGAQAYVDNEAGFNFVGTNPAPYSGEKVHKSSKVSGMHQHYFTNASASLKVPVGSELYCWIFLESVSMPREIMLQWNSGDWEHRAYWGENLLDWGTDGTTSRKSMGALPKAGEWVRLSVPASAVGLEGQTVTGMAFSLYDGAAAWDAAGVYMPEGDGTGLRGEYFSNTSLTGEPATGEPKLVRSGETVNFNWGEGSPASSIPADYFSARWIGQVQPRYSETYTFYTSTDDGVRLWVNGQLLIDHWVPQGETEWTGTIALEAGKKYDIKMEYYEQYGGTCAKLSWSSPSQAKEIIPKSCLYLPPDLNGNGMGLKGEYFNDINLNNLKLSRSDKTINYEWSTGSPDASLPVDYFSVRWTGQVQPRYTGTYTFKTNTDDGVRLWVNGSKIIDDWNVYAPKDNTGTISLEAGKKYDIRMEYFENGGGASAKLYWSSDRQSEEIVPESQLYLPEENSGNGTGLTAEYYNDATFTNLAVSRIDPQVNFNWNGGSPDPNVIQTHFSTRWSGYIQTKYTDTYKFYVNPYDSSKLWIDNQLVLNNVGEGSIYLTSGEMHTIKMEYLASGSAPAVQLFWSSSLQAKEVIPSTQLYPLGGLKGEYFNDTNFTTLKNTRIDKFVDFNWESGSPDPTVGTDYFSVRWSGQVQPLYSENYTFYTSTDDGARLWVDGMLLIDDWNIHAETEMSASVQLEAGKKYDIVMEYYEEAGGAVARLKWSSPSQAKQIIPQSQLSPSMEFFKGSFEIEPKSMQGTVLRSTQLKNYPDDSTDPHCKAISPLDTVNTEDLYSQEYSFVEAGNGAYFIKVNNFNKYLTIHNGGVYAANYIDCDEQKWYIRHVSNGYYRFISKALSAKCLTQGGQYPDGVYLADISSNDNQLWKLIQFAPDENNFSQTVTDMDVCAPVLNPPLVRKYDPSVNMGSMGKGWMTGFEGRLLEYSEVTQYNTRDLKVIATLPDGSIHNYTRTQGDVTIPDGANYRKEFPYISADSKSFLTWYILLDPQGNILDNKYRISTQDKTTYYFNGDGSLSSIVDRYDNKMTITYTGKKIEKVRYPNGRYLKYRYGTTAQTCDLITEILDCNQNDMCQRSVSYEYDTKSRLLKRFIDVEGKSTYYSYDNYGLLCGISDNNRDTTAAMDIQKQGNSKGRAYSTTDAFGNTIISTQYMETNGGISWTFTKDSTGRKTISRLDYNNHIQISYDADGGRTATVYYSDIKDGITRWDGVIKGIDRYDNVTYYEVDPNNHNSVTKITNPDGSFKCMWYDSDNLTAVTDEEGYSTLYRYDGVNLSKECRFKNKVQPGTKPDWPAVESAPEVAVTSYAYNTQTGCKIKGLITCITEPSGVCTDYSYESDGTLLSATSYKNGSSEAATTTYQYDGLGFKISETSPEGYTTNYTYDNKGNTTRIIKRDKSGMPQGTTRITYDHMGRKLKVVSPGAYNADLDVDGQYDPNLQESTKYTTYTYYPSGKVRYEDDAGRSRTTYTYDIYGNLKTKETPESATYTYNYDILDRLTSVWFTESNSSPSLILEKYIYTSDLTHPIKLETTYLNDYETATSLSEFDYAGRLLRKVNPDDTFTSTEYNKNGTVYITKDENGSETRYSYNGFCSTNGTYESKLTQLSGNSYSFVKFEYDKDEKVTAESYGGTTAPAFDTGSPMMKKTYEYYYNGLLRKMNKSIANISNIAACDEYEYDKDGNITTEKTYQSDRSVMVTSYENNYLGKPVRKTVTENKGNIYPNDFDSTESVTLETQYVYDPNGNIIHETAPNGVTTDYQYDYQNRLTKRTRPVRNEYGQDDTSVLNKGYSWDGKLTHTDEDGIYKDFIYDRRRNLVRIITHGQSGPEISSTYYDRAGRAIAEVSAANYDSSKILEAMNRTVYTYDKMSRMSTVGFKGIIKQYNPTTGQLEDITSDIVQKAYQYDSNGNVIKELDASGFLAGTGTLAKDRIRTGYGTEYIYDRGNRLIQVIDPVSMDKGLAFRTKYIYDALGRVIDEIEPTGNDTSSCAKTSYTYDSAGNVLTTSRAKCATDGTIMGAAVVLNTSTYNRCGNVLTYADGNNNTTIYEYNQQGELRKETFIGDTNIPTSHKKYQYDNMGNLVKAQSPVSDAVSKVIISSYDNFGRVISEREETATGDESFTTSKYYDTDGRLKREVNGNGAETWYAYDSSNRVIEVKTDLNNSNEPERSHIKRMSYDKNGNTVSEDRQIVVNDTTHSITRYTYDALDRLIEVTDPAGNVIQHLTYNCDGLQTAAYDADGHMTVYQYDKNGRNICTIDPSDHGVSIEYDNCGNVFRKTDAKGHVIENTYNIFNELTEVKACNVLYNEITSFEYDNNGNMTEMKDANNNITLYRYNAGNKVSMKIDPQGLDTAGQPIAGKYEQYSYNPDGSMKSKVDRNGNTISYTYNVHGYMTSQSGPGLSITYQYDNNGNQTQMTDATGTTIRTYDKLGRVLTKTVPGIGTLKFSYDIISGIPSGDGLYAEEIIDPKGNITTRTYDVCGRLKTVTDGTLDGCTKNVALGIYPGGSVDFWSAEKATDGIIDANNYCDSYLWGAGNGLQYIQLDLQNSFDISQINLWHFFGDIRSYHDVIVQLSNTADFSTGVTTVFNNDTDNSAGNGTGSDAEYTETSTGKTIKFNTVNARYVRFWSNGSTANASNHYSEIQVLGKTAQTSKTTYDYNADGSRESVTYPGGTKEEYAYNPDGLPVSLVNKKADGSIINSYTYQYDENHNIYTVITNEPGMPTKTDRYGYDWLNRVNYIESSDGKNINYTYDNAGNRTNETVMSGGAQQQETTYTYDNRNRLTQAVTQYTGVAAATTVSNTYDNNGNLTQVSQDNTVKQTNTYSCLNELVQTIADGHTIINQYNGEGKRVSKKVDTTETKYLYDGNQVTLEIDGTGNQKARNIYGINLISRDVGGEVLYYLYNLHGDVTSLVNASGTVMETYAYDIFGNVTSVTGNKDNPYTYGGYYYDKETGLYYLGSRMYDPMSARFLQEDTCTGEPGDPLTLNLYAYCANNPMSYLDPDGHSFLSFFKDAYNFIDKYSNQILAFDANVLMVVAGVALMGATFGGASMLAAGMIGAGINGAIYTATNFNSFSWGQWGANTGSGFVTGALTAGVGSGIGALGWQGAKAVAAEVVAGAAVGALDSYVSNGIQTGEWSGSNAARAAGLGAAAGAAGAAIGAGASKIMQRIEGLKACSKIGRAGRVAASIVGGAGAGALTGWVANGIMTNEWTGENAARAAYLGAAAGAAGGAIPGISRSFGMCFVAGTMVATANGLTAIENIKSGDEVYAENVETGEKGLKKVTEVFESEADVIVEVKTDKEEIETTVFHPFCVEKDGTKSFVEAQYLKEGDQIVTKDGKTMKVKSKKIKYMDHVVKVYNFEVADWHDYYVGEGNLLVHNAQQGTGCMNKALEEEYPALSSRPKVEEKKASQVVEHKQAASAPVDPNVLKRAVSKNFQDMDEYIFNHYEKNQWSESNRNPGLNEHNELPSVYHNDNRHLPRYGKKDPSTGRRPPLTYHEYDAHKATKYKFTKEWNRGSKRFVRDNNGVTYYTDDHYLEFHMVVGPGDLDLANYYGFGKNEFQFIKNIKR